MNRKTLLIVGGSLVVVAFLLGFIPQYVKARGLTDQISAERQQLNSAREKSEMDELGLLCGRVYLQTNLKNFGLAGQYATNFFDHVRAMNGQAPESSHQAFLQSALAKRDSITQGLAKGDASVGAELQDLFQSTLETTQAGPK